MLKLIFIFIACLGLPVSAMAEEAKTQEKRFPFLEENFFDGKKIPFEEFDQINLERCGIKFPRDKFGFSFEDVCRDGYKDCFEFITLKKSKDKTQLFCALHENIHSAYAESFKTYSDEKKKGSEKTNYGDVSYMGKFNNGHYLHFSRSLKAYPHYSGTIDIYPSKNRKLSCFITCSINREDLPSKPFSQEEINEVKEFTRILAATISFNKRGKKK